MKSWKIRLLTIALTALCVLSLTLASLPLTAVSAEEAALTNIALGKSVTAENSMEGLVFFGAAQLTDGRHGEEFVAEEPLGWHNNTTLAGTSSAENPTYLYIDFDATYSISAVELIPMRFYNVSILPKDLELQASADGETWVTLASDTNVRCLWGEGEYPLYVFEPVEASMFRVSITKDSDPEAGLTGIGEIEIYGTKVIPPETEPEATEPTATEPTATEPTATEPTATEPETAEPDTSKTDDPGCAGLVGVGAVTAVLIAGAAPVCRKKD